MVYVLGSIPNRITYAIQILGVWLRPLRPKHVCFQSMYISWRWEFWGLFTPSRFYLVLKLLLKTHLASSTPNSYEELIWVESTTNMQGLSFYWTPSLGQMSNGVRVIKWNFTLDVHSTLHEHLLYPWVSHYAPLYKELGGIWV